jgi:hypothetical protein
MGDRCLFDGVSGSYVVGFVRFVRGACLDGLGWGRSFAGIFNTEEERGPRRATEKIRATIRSAVTIPIFFKRSVRSAILSFSVALRGPRSFSVLKGGWRGSTGGAVVAPGLTP